MLVLVEHTSLSSRSVNFVSSGLNNVVPCGLYNKHCYAPSIVVITIVMCASICSINYYSNLHPGQDHSFIALATAITIINYNCTVITIVNYNRKTYSTSHWYQCSFLTLRAIKLECLSLASLYRLVLHQRSRLCSGYTQFTTFQMLHSGRLRPCSQIKACLK